MVSTPAQVTPTIQAPPQTASEGQIKQLRDMVAALQASKSRAVSPFYTWANGLDDMSSKIMAGMLGRQADQKEAAMHTAVGQNVANLGDPSGASSTPANAAGGAAPATPFSTGQNSSAVDKKYKSAAEEAKAIREGKWRPAEDEPLSPAAAASSYVPPVTAPPPPGGITMAGRQPATFAEVMGGTNGMLGAQPPPSMPVPPTMLAQAAPSPQPGDWQRRLSEFYRRQGAANQSINVQDAIKNYEGALPQYGLTPLGGVIRQAPGQMPESMGQMPGHPGLLEFNKDYGVTTQTKIGPNGQPEVNIIPPQAPKVQQGNAPASAPPTSPKPAATPPPAAPKTAPVAPSGGNSPPGGPVTPKPGMLATEPPGGVPKPGARFAAADIDPYEEVANSVRGKGSSTKLAQLKDENLKIPEIDLENPTRPDQQAAKEALDEADAHPSAPLKMPNLLQGAINEGTPDAFRNLKSETEVHTRALEDEVKAQNKRNAELQKNIEDTAYQSSILAPDVKTAIRIIESPDFHTGPANRTIEMGRGLREEFGSLIKDLESGYVKKGEKLPGWLQSAKDWALNPDNRTATANQVYTKIIAGATLRSLRGMLGPNSGQFRKIEIEMLERAFGNPNMTKDANRVVMSMIDKINDRNILIGEMAHQYVQKHNKLDANFQRALARFEQKSPVFNADEYDKFFKLTAGGGTPEAPSSTRTIGGKTYYKRGDKWFTE